MNIFISEVSKIKQKLKEDNIHYFIFIIYILGILLLFSIFYLNKKFNIPFEKLTGDPALIFNSHPFIGFLSNIGVLIWCFTASVCYFTSLILLKKNDKINGMFFLGSAIFTSLLLIDDFFMFHDYIFYSFKNFQIAQPITFTMYAVFLFWYIIKFYKVILNSIYIFLVLGVGFLGLSAFTDIIFESLGFEYFIEDSFKFIGIINWMLFFTISSYKLILNKLNF
ncbi:MAG: hypothetical protein K9I95_06055 [Flavobacteriaceae bacterium]|nr:hypothetical protein [Flavobacteriaceae bacterium]